MKYRDLNFTIAICVSLALHVLIWAYSADRYARQSRIYLPSIWQHSRTVTIRLANDPKKPDLPEHDEIGEATGTGVGSNPSEGDRPIQAPQADSDQAFLSRSPSGPKSVVPPIDLDGPLGEGGHGGQRGAVAVQAPARIDEPTPPAAAPAADASSPPPPAKVQIAIADAQPAPPPQPHDLRPPGPAASASVPVPGMGKAAKPLEEAADVDAGADPRRQKPLEASDHGLALARSAPRGDTPDWVQSLPTPAPPPDSELAHEAPRALPAGPLLPDLAAAAVATAAPLASPPATPTAAIAPPTPAAPSPSPAVKVAAAPASAPPPRPTTGDGRAPGRPSSAAPAPLSDTDSDAFAKIGSAVLHNGRLTVRQGRKIRATKPQILVPGLLDTLGLEDPTVVLSVNIDATGKVTYVEVFRSSGSNDLDQPCLRAMYDWWFEPARDAKGKPIADAFPFAITFR